MFRPMMLGSGGLPGGTTWNPADKNTAITLSNNNRTATNPSTNAARGVRAISSQSAGKLFFEVKALSVVTDTAYGIANAAASLSNPSSGIVQYGPNQSGDIIGVAIDFFAGRSWGYRNGVLTTVGDPVAGSGGFTLPTGVLFPFARLGLSDAAALNTGHAPFVYAPPSGFSSWG